jgi:acyl-coenzyme A thioesterase PaaI-like protein
VLNELGFAVRGAGDKLHGSAALVPEMSVPGTSLLRASILAIWADTLAGLLVATAVSPRVPVTLELDVQLYRPIPAIGTVQGEGRMVKSGRSVFVSTVEFASEDGDPIATAGGTFMLSPDPTVRLPDELSIDAPPRRTILSVPLAARAGCQRREPGVAILPRSEDGLNSSRTVTGGLIALAAEEAALSLSPGETLCSLGLRYLQPIRVGPGRRRCHGAERAGPRRGS